MNHWWNGAMLAAAALAALVTGSSALADVKAGVDAWAKGDYAAAVHEWEGPAAAGDPDAMFNLAQAYRLGRGVSIDPAKAEQFYAKAAAKGHLQAADTYGLMLFQDGRREAALPYVQDAARRGDPRSEYILGIAHFNGDLAPKDWVKAYALLSMANAQGLPQATAALAQMDRHVPLAQRQQASGLAIEMQKQAEAARGRTLAAADLGTGISSGTAVRIPAAPAPETRPVTRAPVATDARPAPRIATSPSVAAALDAVAQARHATGTESPAQAGASYARHPGAMAPQLANGPTSRSHKAAAPEPKPAAGVAVGTPAPKSAAPQSGAGAAAPANGPWRVQLGAFSVHGNADKLWTQLSTRTELAGKPRITVTKGALTKLQAGGFPDRDAADAACRSLRHHGHECLVTR